MIKLFQFGAALVVAGAVQVASAADLIARLAPANLVYYHWELTDQRPLQPPVNGSSPPSTPLPQ